MTTVFMPQDVSVITRALRDRLAEALPAVHGITAAVERSEPVNTNPDRCPWVGVYRERASLPPRALGMGAGYRQHGVTLILLLNAATAESGAACEDELERLLRAVLATVLSDPTIGGTVEQLTDVDITYYNYTVNEKSFFQEAEVRVTAVTNVTPTDL